MLSCFGPVFIPAQVRGLKTRVVAGVESMVRSVDVVKKETRVCTQMVGHMDFISPHPPRLSGKEIQGEPRGTF